MEDALQLANSPAGQQLLALLRQSDSGQLQQVMDQVSSGHYTQASQSLKRMLSSPEAKKLLEEMGG